MFLQQTMKKLVFLVIHLFQVAPVIDDAASRSGGCEINLFVRNTIQIICRFGEFLWRVEDQRAQSFSGVVTNGDVQWCRAIRL